MVADRAGVCYDWRIVRDNRWVLLAYRLPREPSTPRIALWRRLRRLGALQVVDGLVALPLDPHAREQLEWLAEGVLEAGGEATVWLGEPAAAVDAQSLAEMFRQARAEEYAAITSAAEAARAEGPAERRRAVRRLREELRRVRARDSLDAGGRAEAEAAVEALAALAEVRA